MAPLGGAIDATIEELKAEGKFTLVSFGTLAVVKAKVRKGLSPRTLEPIKVRAGKPMRIKASPALPEALQPNTREDCTDGSFLN